MNIAPKNINLSLLVILTTLSTYAAPPAGPPAPSPMAPPPPGFPIDGSIVLLAIAAVLYGVYTLKKFNLQSK